MKDEYDFSKGKQNPYVEKLKKQVTINVDDETMDFFKTQAKDAGVPYQMLMNLYLSDCAKQGKHLRMSWE